MFFYIVLAQGGEDQTKAHPDRLNFIGFQNPATVSLGGKFGRQAWSSESLTMESRRGGAGRPLRPGGITPPDVGCFLSNHFQ